MKTKVECFEDIVFENRNKNYGAYELRKRYSKRGAIALIISISIFLFAAGAPLIAKMMNPGNINGYVPYDHSGGLIDIINKKPEDVKPPELPKPPADVKAIKFTAPKIVDSVTDSIMELDIPEDIPVMSNGPVDTSTHIEIIDSPTISDFDNKIVEIFDVTEKPEFPGGDAALLKYVAQNIKYPEEAITANAEGTVYIRFVVTKTGTVGQAHVLRPVDHSLEAEALRVVKTLPQWIPGKHNGNPVNVWFIIPVRFKLEH